MTIFDPTDPANAIIKPTAAMYLRLEHPNASTGKRISLSSLGSLLAAGLLPGETAPISTSPLLSADFGQPSRAGSDDIPEAAAQQAPAGTPA